MSALDKIKEPITKDIIEFQSEFKLALNSEVKMINSISGYLVKNRGKTIRPILTLLCSRLCGDPTSFSYKAAAMMELLHVATLIHDDIVDDSHIRRNFLTLNALWKNKISVLVGDFFLSKALLLSTENKDYDLLNEVSLAVKEISEGELFQIQKSRSFSLSEKEYLDIISKKTASLFACCCKVGSISSGIKDLDKINTFGNYLGIIFQIKDDLFDYSTKRIGKPTKLDLKTQKITLPLIHSIERSSSEDKRKIRSIIKKKKYLLSDKKLVNEFITKYNGFEYAHQRMNDFKKNALELLKDFPQNESNNSVKILLDYIIERKY